MLNFKHYNILLDNGVKTMGDELPLLGNTQVWESIKKSVHLFLPPPTNDYTKMKVADLGCLEGGYAIEFARMGFQTIGIDARQDNIDYCNYAKDHLSLPNLQFHTDDVWNLDKYGKFDIIFNYGLLYHLDRPVEFLKFSSGINTKLLILQTHFAPLNDIRYNLGAVNNYFIGPLQKRLPSTEKSKNYRLSKEASNEGYKGRWFKEWGKSVTRKVWEKYNLAAFNNQRSFWLYKTELVKAIKNAGYSHVFERFDYTGDILPENYTARYNRSMFVCVKD